MLLGWIWTGVRVRDSSLWAGQTDGWMWQRLSKPFVTAVLLKSKAILEPENERSTGCLGPRDASVKSMEG